MNLNDFSYDLPGELIAQSPVSPRDQSRLMVIDRAQKSIRHDTFCNIGKYLPPQSALVVNDSRVIPARIFGQRETGGQVEIFLLQKLEDPYSFKAMLKPLRRIKVGEKIKIGGNGLYAELVDVPNRIVRFNKKNIFQVLDRIGHMPLPPYIKRTDTPDDHVHYQTVYAKNPGSVAAPTAGLHFTQELIAHLKKQGHVFEKVTLHVNYATFKSVEENDITQHKMHEETYRTSSETFRSLQETRQKGSKVVAIGTTSCRVLETIADTEKLEGETNIFIYPGYKFLMTDILVTNFHLPLSTLLMLVYAFGGETLMKNAYQEAIKHKYRFYSYGDAMVIV